MKPSRFVDDSARKSWVVYCVNGFAKKMPALFTRASTEPNRSTALATIFSAVEAKPISPSTRVSLSERGSCHCSANSLGRSRHNYGLLSHKHFFIPPVGRSDQTRG